MKKFYIEIPYTGVLKVEVRAESLEEALEKIYENDRNDIINDKVEDISFVDIEEDYHEKVVEGNVFYGTQNDLRYEELDDEDE